MKRFQVLFVALVAMSGCASQPPVRARISTLPPLDGGLSRVYVSAGVMKGVKLRSVHQVGPVFIDGYDIGSTQKDEYFVVDLPPGNYEAYCQPEQPYKNFSEKRQISLTAGETLYLACDMMTKGAGWNFGVVGQLMSKYLTKSFLVDRPLDPNSRLVSFSKFSEIKELGKGGVAN
ncbi:DUF2846 domain-containing protein [Dyella ginsengisoli]|uniref:DUF2846 domain-containing protein n=1 Tax=Dyella ginsengisoli TaxID=363848 RepID=UPI0009FF339E|nr:DUF2846 domain-containing protein [Dyella ginsengisoli]